ncbi:unnamed protein product [Fusarium graminearum]|uniref:Cutinase n=1 Tax=Gibberella zeae (strain ATCC MYA-4620 / CBS 123657 / FGSC 9075 / NRRL 31084 / PH-1) TaxID=229533 RepID=I1RD78_GIBZE|nr:cutinase precursor [Fusarium graminearum PH-1]ESU06898.1 cutinase precursor [Fusarium graminearum PH-1]CZS76986.1 unnamed protein product [Fusarium graminearum]|eukprot:XP_011317383.1 cutinase precursor [Fusarium graminearum PH-1]
MLYTSILVALVPFAVAGPIAPRTGLGGGLPGLGGGSGSGLPSLPGLGGGDSGSGSGLPSLPGLGGGSGSGLPSLPGLGGGSGSGGLPSLPGLGGGSGSGSGLPSLPGLGGGSGGLPGLGGDDSSDDTPSATAPSVVAPTASPQTSPTAPSSSTGGSTDADGSAARRGIFDGASSGGASDSPFGNFLGGAGGSSSGGAGGSTMNDLSGECKDVTVIFARGTTEAGNVGTAAGPPFFKALGEKIGQDKLAVQGVDYSASIAGIMQMGDKAGSEKMASLVTEAVKKCPKTKIVMSGYSQGAMLVHNAARALPAETTAKVAAVLNFGDPFQRQAIQGVPADRVKIICHAGDGVCAGTAAITPDHLTYSKDAGAAADFVASKVQ